MAQKPRTRRQGTVEDGRKRRRRTGEKGRVDMHTEEQAIRQEEGKKEEKNPNRRKQKIQEKISKKKNRKKIHKTTNVLSGKDRI